MLLGGKNDICVASAEGQHGWWQVGLQAPASHTLLGAGLWQEEMESLWMWQQGFAIPWEDPRGC